MKADERQKVIDSLFDEMRSAAESAAYSRYSKELLRLLKKSK